MEHTSTGAGHGGHGPVPSVAEHAARIRALVRFEGVEHVPLSALLGRVLAADAVSSVDLPLFRNSQMDGYAVRTVDLPATLPVVGEVAARPGRPAPLAPGTTVKIMTGAIVPDGADAVVPVEDAAADAGTATLPATALGTFVRERGTDLRAGDVLVPAGTRIGSRHIAALAAAGVREASVRRRPRIALISTGAELADEPTQPGQIHDANLPALVAAVIAAGGEVVGAARVTDDVEAFERVLDTSADVIVTSGGISMGDHEVVREALDGWFGHIAMQPGGPQGVSVVDGVPVLSFPGNPVSTQLSFEVFLAPLLREWSGLPAAAQEERSIATSVTSPAGREQYHRGRLLPDGRVDLASGPGSHLVAGLAAADCLIVIPAEATSVAAGSMVRTWAL